RLGAALGQARVHCQPEYRAHDPRGFSSLAHRERPAITVSAPGGHLQVRSVERAVVDNFDEHLPIAQPECPPIARMLPAVDEIRRPPLQHPYGRLEIKRRLRCQSHWESIELIGTGRQARAARAPVEMRLV